MSKSTTGEYIAALGDQDWRVREAAAQALGNMGAAQAVEPLIVALRDQDKYVRKAAAQALGNMGADQAIEPLIAALRDQDSPVRGAAAQALGNLRATQAVEPLIAALRDSHSYHNYVRKVAAQALVRIGEPAVEPLIATLRDTNWRVRDAVVKALGQSRSYQINHTTVVNALLGTLDKDRNWNVRKTAAKTLRDFLPKIPTESHDQIKASLSRFEREYEIHQQELLDDDDGC